MDTILSVEAVQKKLGSKQVLKNINFEVSAGKIIGLLGSNGSGKTTLMKSIAGIMHPNSGVIKVDGVEVGVETKSIVSFMPDSFTIERNMKLREAISFSKDFFTDFDEEKALDMLQFMKLDKEARLKTLSKGMLERLALVLSLSRNAKLYLLDEPIGGIDPVAREKILEAILNYYSPTSTIILSTHLIHDIEHIFDEVIFIKDGEIKLQENVEDIRLKRKSSILDLFKEVYAEC